ncbi:Golgi integral membrane protein 4 isoform 1 [Daubentonia madagascariensis]|uniref:Golgi integral membrane protein 4 isoform 1 n=1 Tax=Daubentonia madagascariensis TaxID=31869 RepID=A0ABD2F620_DAUMA
MGNGMCSRKQKRIFQTLLLLTVVFGFLYGAMLYYELQTQLRKAEAVALKYQQHQESLSAQLQVVYEHRSRLEKSLQKERLEHKKAKEDFLVYKLEAQETLNKGRQDSNSRYSALNVQHQMLKSQHEELKKQHSDLEEEHRKQGEDFSRTFNDHKQKYLQLQQEKEQELSKLKETVYNLREENRQLRKAHQDIHTQLQDVKQQHKNLLSEHEQLVVTLEDHKSALAAAQTQVAEYKQLKDTLNRIPSFRKPDRAEQQNVTQVAHSLPGYNTAREKPTREPQEVSRNSDVWQKHEAIPGRTEETKPYPPTYKEVAFQAAGELGHQEAEPREPEEHQVEEEHRKALEEEEMEQVGQAEHLEEEHDPSPEEQDREWKEHREQKEEANLLEGHTHAQVYPSFKPVTKFRSPYEEQLEQQKLAALRAEEAQRLREHQEALHQQRQQGHLLQQQQQQQQLAREVALQAVREEGQHPRQEQLRQQGHYDTMDNDIVQGAEDQGIQEEEGAYERDNQHQDEAEGDPGNRHEPHEQGPQEADPESEADRAVVEDINPADDPNNQGEDEFEEAEQVREENLPDENEEQKQSIQKQENAEMEEHLVMAGNPDQQEDNVDEQYQEEGEEEVQEDLTEEKKRELEHNAEETYGENDENADDKNNDGEEQEVRDDNHPKGREEHYEEEEEEEEDGAAVAEKSHRRAEM